MTANVERWRPLVRAALADTASPVPEGMVLAIIEAESSGNPAAYRGEAAIRDGSIGLMQILYGTARGEGYTGAPGDKNTQSGLFKPDVNILYGVKHLTALWNGLGNVADVASAYNGGIRPNLGFGRVFPGPGTVTVCLERDSAGKCIRSRTVKPGEYGNADYVNKVVKLTQQYSGAQSLPPVVVGGGGPAGGTTSLGVLVALVAGAGALWMATKR